MEDDNTGKVDLILASEFNYFHEKPPSHKDPERNAMLSTLRSEMLKVPSDRLDHLQSEVDWLFTIPRRRIAALPYYDETDDCANKYVALYEYLRRKDANFASLLITNVDDFEVQEVKSIFSMSFRSEAMKATYLMFGMKMLALFRKKLKKAYSTRLGMGELKSILNSMFLDAKQYEVSDMLQMMEVHWDITNRDVGNKSLPQICKQSTDEDLKINTCQRLQMYAFLNTDPMYTMYYQEAKRLGKQTELATKLCEYYWRLIEDPETSIELKCSILAYRSSYGEPSLGFYIGDSTWKWFDARMRIKYGFNGDISIASTDEEEEEEGSRKDRKRRRNHRRKSNKRRKQ